MFGFVIANREMLDPEQLKRYRGCYCGLCRALRERHGQLSRFILNYDMTFLVLLLSSLYEPEESQETKVCLAHPFKKQRSWQNRFTEYAADMNVALAYHSLLDKWSDDRNLLSIAEARALRSSYQNVKDSWPEQCLVIEECLDALREIEKERCDNPDEAANQFGRLMGRIFAVGSDRWNESLRMFGEALGRFIYMLDACVDFEKDKKHGSYNPLVAMGKESVNDEEMNSILTLLIGECTGIFERLPLVQDVDIMRNVLYCGVWGRYTAMKKKRGEAEKNE